MRLPSSAIPHLPKTRPNATTKPTRSNFSQWTLQKMACRRRLSVESSRTTKRCRPRSGTTRRMLARASAYPYSPSAAEPKRRAMTTAIRKVANRTMASPAKIDALLINIRRGNTRASTAMLRFNSAAALQLRLLRQQRDFRESIQGGFESRGSRLLQISAHPAGIPARC